ncbi:MAG: radical SAM protein [Thermoplasmata archaeon]
MEKMNFDERPMIVFYEVTKACMLSCKHCRANAVFNRDPRELNLVEIDKLAGELESFGRPWPIVIISGGDPLMRGDLFDVLDVFNSHNLITNIAFSGTKLVTEKKIEKIAERVKTVAISLDGADAAVHDAWRGIKGTFDTSIQIISLLKEYGVRFQINTTVSNFNLENLRKMPELLGTIEPDTWDLFFLIPTGRAQESMMIESGQAENFLKEAYAMSKNIKYRIKVTEAPFYNRVKLQNGAAEKTIMRDEKGRGITDGRGTMFISHIGEVNPTGFLPEYAGNVKNSSLVELYRKSEIFNLLRDPDKLKGKCGVCKYRYICGGSRARAYAIYGDYLAEDPLCGFVPEANENGND